MINNTFSGLLERISLWKEKIMTKNIKIIRNINTSVTFVKDRFRDQNKYIENCLLFIKLLFIYLLLYLLSILNLF